MRVTFSALAAFAVAISGCTTSDLGPGLPQVMASVPAPRPSDLPAPGTAADAASTATADPSSADGETARGDRVAHAHLDRMISRYATAYRVPERLVRRVVARESHYNPSALHAGNYGLMQIRYRTARVMGYRGAPKGLLDAGTNLKYAVKYLAGAYRVAGRNEIRAVRLYARGYYYDAKRLGLLIATGLKPASASAAETVAAAPVEAAAALASAAASRPSDPFEASVPAIAPAPPATAVGFAGSTPASAPVPTLRPTF